MDVLSTLLKLNIVRKSSGTWVPRCWELVLALAVAIMKLNTKNKQILNQGTRSFQSCSIDKPRGAHPTQKYAFAMTNGNQQGRVDESIRLMPCVVGSAEHMRKTGTVQGGWSDIASMCGDTLLTL